MLGGSGHIAGIVNPPHKNKYGYWTNDTLPETHEEWMEGATFNEGSWWPHWQAWMTDNGYVDADPKKLVPARQPGEGGANSDRTRAGPLCADDDSRGARGNPQQHLIRRLADGFLRSRLKRSPLPRMWQGAFSWPRCC
ncbi:hypothetical protein HAALTHF_46600n [Vreelandella aquamarina]|nr:hypothetical protein HAALTHF_46600n [Halomonas axialensis]